jgi:ABC-type bacteriocin/lantibiotic exporter with double-glycine peptidase domain
MLIVGVYLLLNQQINIGQFIAADIVILAVINSVEKLILTLDKAYDSLTAIEKLNNIKSAALEDSGNELVTSKKGIAIGFNGVNFKYPDGKHVLQDVSFNINEGEKVLIVGASGSGKSTLLRLLTGTFTAFEGSIRINNIAIGSYSIKSLRSNTSVLISQQDIFQGTLRDNITMGDTAVESYKLFEISKKTGLDNFISGLEMGFDSIIDPAGKKLPEKIKQGILLARALLNKKQLFLLENPFDGLSTETIEETKQTILDMQESTVLITASSNLFKEVFNKVIYIENGMIISIETINNK